LLGSCVLVGTIQHAIGSSGAFHESLCAALGATTAEHLLGRSDVFGESSGLGGLYAAELAVALARLETSLDTTGRSAARGGVEHDAGGYDADARVWLYALRLALREAHREGRDLVTIYDW